VGLTITCAGKKPENRRSSLGLPLAEPGEILAGTYASSRCGKSAASPKHAPIAASNGNGGGPGIENFAKTGVRWVFPWAEMELARGEKNTACGSCPREQCEGQLAIPRQSECTGARGTQAASRRSPIWIPMSKRHEPHRHLEKPRYDYGMIRQRPGSGALPATAGYKFAFVFHARSSESAIGKLYQNQSPLVQPFREKS
jgi:hypothetical protein